MLKKRFYVYIHVDENEVVYVGKGCGSRLLETRGRQEDHKKFMLSKFNEGEYSFAVMLKHKLSEDEALNLESRLINYCRPRFNKQGKWREGKTLEGLVVSRLLDDLEWFEDKEKKETEEWLKNNFPAAYLIKDAKEEYYAYVDIPKHVIKDFPGQTKLRLPTKTKEEKQAKQVLKKLEKLMHDKLRQAYFKIKWC